MSVGSSLSAGLGTALLMNKNWQIDVTFDGLRFTLAVSKSTITGLSSLSMIMCFGAWLSSP